MTIRGLLMALPKASVTTAERKYTPDHGEVSMLNAVGAKDSGN